MGKAAFTVGRFQPPTIGHKALLEAVKKAAGPDGQAFVFVSSTMTPKAKNPLTSAQKMPILQTLVPTGITFVDTQECKDKGEPCGGALHAFYWLIDKKGYSKEDLTLVVGDDRKPEFGPTADIWKRKEEKDVYAPGDFVFLKSDKRNPDLEIKDAANMSGTKAREYVKKDRKDDFYRAIGYDTVADTTAADTVYQIIKSSQASKGKTGGARDLHEVAYGADAEFTYPVRKTLRHKNQWRKRAGTARRRAARK